jgi:hypothetical protein
MPSPSADDRSPVTSRSSGGAARSRTGKFLQGIFGSGSPPAPSVNMSPSNQPPQELVQVVSEPSNWDDGDNSNWDDDFMDEPIAQVPAPAIPATPATDVVVTPVVAPPPPPSVISPPAIVDEVLSSPAVEPPTISVNIPRPKNIKYKTKDAQAPTAMTPPTGMFSGDKAEPVEFKVKRPASIKYKVPPVAQPSWREKLLAPGRNLWHQVTNKLTNWGDIIPTQLTEHPQKILGILAAVLLSIVTSWAVVNFWPPPSAVVTALPPITNAGVAPVSPEETLVAAVRSQFNTLASQYPAGLINNLELDNEQQLAIVTLGNLWGSLAGDQQQQVAQSLWQQARTYQMAKLEMRSGSGNLLARSPVVGQEMVIVSNW